MDKAFIKWVDNRYELTIDGTLKAYSKDTDHDIGFLQLIGLAEEKGYTVIAKKVEK